jgi:streptogramin lyase
MRSTALILACAAAAAIAAAGVAGCKSSASGIPLPGPTLAPTLPPGVVTEYAVPTAGATPLGITLGADGNMWFSELNGNMIGKVTPAGAISEMPLAAGSGPVDIVEGPNNSVWFVEATSSKIGEMTTAGVLTEFPTNTANAGPLGLAVDPTHTNHLWFGESNVGKIGMITAGGVVTEYTNTLPGNSAVSVAVTADGTVWYLDDGRDTLGQLTFPGGVATFTDYNMPIDLNQNVVAGLSDMAVGPDGNLYFTASQTDDVCQAVPVSPPTIGCENPPSDLSGSFNTVPFGIVSDPTRGVLWFAEAAAGQIARITTSGTITEWGIPGTGTTAVGVAIGPDVVAGPNTADLWFTDSSIFGLTTGTNQVGKVNLGLLPAKTLAKTRAQFTSHTRMLHVDKRSLIVRRTTH